MPKYHKSRNPINTTPFFSRRSKMPSQRRVKVIGLLVFVGILTLLFWTMRDPSSPHDLDASSSGDFYSKTVNALDGKTTVKDKETLKKFDKEEKDKKTIENEDAKIAKEMSQRLKEAAKLAKDKTNNLNPKPDPPSSVVGVGSSADGAREKGVAGRKKFSTPSGGEGTQEVIKDGSGKKEEEEEVMTPERRAAKTELNRILKKAPIIIFSKSYCPHSARAKRILLNQYSIDPKPFVVELDKHEIGADLQALLGDLTGRRTVPNVLVNGVSIGGGDDVAAMDEKKTLKAKISELGGKKILEMKEVAVVVEEKKSESHEGHEGHEGHDGHIAHGLR